MPLCMTVLPKRLVSRKMELGSRVSVTLDSLTSTQIHFRGDTANYVIIFHSLIPILMRDLGSVREYEDSIHYSDMQT